ncbi:aminodeoxychorismate synthase component I [Bacillus dakarensis]|uniref:aminodeoxychorismate synthase component I n=1 Tax=Robertmurraya dakarensis TaxID=1926278 RepID=UPI000980DDDF|nr:aminodeoxychorismate synthase component I [Bacillus dakarensis]
MNRKKPLLSFEFAGTAGVVPHTFSDPENIIIANTVEEVLPCLESVQHAVDKGYYAAGFLSYESAPAFDPAFKVKDGNTMPLLWFAIFSDVTHEPINGDGPYTLTKWKQSVSMSEYEKAIDSIKHYIECGDTYQTNYTIRLTSQFQGDDISFFKKLKNAQASDYCAYINTGDHTILSASPELFFHLEGEKITTRPMKGTIKRGTSFAEDEKNANWLYHSEKNRAENVMIVDLLRNDLNMIAQPGTVHVPKLFEIERYPTLYQMTSTIEAKVSRDLPLFQLFKALFPCGSITGAPKISTMDIISELETMPREVYCGAIGFITPKKEAIFNVPIRTVMIEQLSGKATYGVGGGITWDSTSDGEYEEILTKARLLEENTIDFQLLESLLLDQGQYFLIEEHLLRLEHTAHYFGFQCEIGDVKKALLEFALKHPEGQWKVRLLLDEKANLLMEGAPATPLESPLKMVIADRPINKNNPFLYHKTTNRSIYDEFQEQKNPNAFDILLWNENGELTEFTNGNIVLEIDGERWTPSVTSGLLAGTFRSQLLKQGKIQEKILFISDIKRSTRVWFINSVRKWVEVQFIDGQQ